MAISNLNLHRMDFIFSPVTIYQVHVNINTPSSLASRDSALVQLVEHRLDNLTTQI